MPTVTVSAEDRTVTATSRTGGLLATEYTDEYSDYYAGYAPTEQTATVTAEDRTVAVPAE